jgi:hypothetical protein
MTTTPAADAFLESLKEQADCYGLLARLAELQHDHIQNSRTDHLLVVLQKRQELLDRIAQLEQIVGPARRDWSHQAEALDGDARSTAEQLFGDIRRCLEAITTADKNDVLVLQQRKLGIAQELKKTTAAQQVNRSYAASAYGKSRPGGLNVSR